MSPGERRGAGRHLARRLVVVILLVGGALTLLATAVQLWIDFRTDVGEIHGRLAQIERSYLEPLEASLWAADEVQTGALLHGMLTLPDIERVELTLEDDAVLAHGETTSTSTEARRWTLSHRYRGQDIHLGELLAIAGHDGAWTRLEDRVVVILASQIANALAVILLLLMVVHYLVTRHLTAMAAFARGLSVDRSPPPLKLRRRPHSGPPDELDDLAEGLERVQQSMVSSYETFQERREELEAAVRHRNAELSAANDRMTRLLGHLPGAIWTVDLEGHVRHIAGRLSEEVRDLGLAVDAPAGSLDATIEGAESIAVAHLRALGGQPVTFELRTPKRTFEVRIEALAGGDGAAAMAVALDVTARRKLEAVRLGERVQQSQKLESLGVLAGGIAHDFNNLLVGILGNAELARARLERGSAAEERIARIETAAERAAELTRQMLAYSGRGRFVVEPVDLAEVVREMASLLEVSISRQATLRFDFGERVPRVDADITQVRQLVMNLITNASDALEDRPGHITVRTRAEHFDEAYLADTVFDQALEPGRYVTLEVTDSGCGMDEHTRARMFDPFFTSKANGHGLGLAATLGIVRGHEGTLQVASEVGLGTTITVILPAREGEEQPMVAPVVEPRARPGRGLVLVVDDNAAVRELVVETLRPEGLEVIEAADGVEALEIYRRRGEDIDVVLLDMVMPRLDGPETFEALRLLAPDVRVVLTSGYSEREATRRFEEHGPAAFLQKPFRIAELLELILGEVESVRGGGPA